MFFALWCNIVQLMPTSHSAPRMKEGSGRTSHVLSSSTEQGRRRRCGGGSVGRGAILIALSPNLVWLFFSPMSINHVYEKCMNNKHVASCTEGGRRRGGDQRGRRARAERGDTLKQQEGRGTATTRRSQRQKLPFGLRHP